MQIEFFPNQPSALGEFILDKSVLDYFITGTLENVIPAYLYVQYSDDADLQAFIASFNSLAQGYLDWFNSTPLGVYTSSSINGPLLDWIGQGIYGISRPVISTLTVATSGQVSTVPVNTSAINRHLIRRSGTVSIATDDIYKRVLTWHLYLGDGRQMSVQWLRRRVARFLYGENGADIPVDYLPRVGITRPSLPAIGALNTTPVNAYALNTHKARAQLGTRALQITIPNTQMGQIFQVLLREGYLAVPFQVNFSVVLQH
ncbi:TPA: hypothetical protein QDC06_000217 [Burkholderia cepacia]|nr:hypothetical protein BZY94_06100 [Burkholderia territorii]HDR9497032.1 hypothetical protein [Burkholderia cepacia]